MKVRTSLLLALLGAILFAFVFHRQSLGLNLVVMELCVVVWALVGRQYPLRGRLALTALAGLVVTSVFTLITHSVFVYVMNFVALTLFLGMLIHPQVRSFVMAVGLSWMNIIEAQVKFVKALSDTKAGKGSLASLIWKSRIFVVPLLIIVVFFVIYGRSNAVFGNLLGDFGTWISTHIARLFAEFDALVIVTFLIGLAICNMFLFRVASKWLVERDAASNDLLVRKRHRSQLQFSTVGLKSELRAGIFLFATLNALLLVVNVIDINWVWFNFDWEAQDLKQFVHEGTYLLIVSILLSVGLVIYFFRRNLNFYRGNDVLQWLSLAWIVQNGVLTISVGIRNFIYIDHFSLAYKRIGVILFLLLTLYGLFTVFVKVFHCKSAFYLLRTNAYAIFVGLSLSALVNWDVMIARYNFGHAEHSWLHLSFLLELNNTALPALDRPLEEVQRLDVIQDSLFVFSKDYMSPEEYVRLVQNRKSIFIERWENKGLWEWNYAEWRVYELLKNGE